MRQENGLKYQAVNILLTKRQRSDLCNYSDTYIVVKGRISVAGTNNDSRRNKKPTFGNNSPLRSCILKTNNIFIDKANDLDIVMPIYNLLEYSDNYFMKVSGIVIEMKAMMKRMKMLIQVIIE